MAEILVYDDAERSIYRDETGTPGQKGHAVTTRTVWKAGSGPANETTLRDRLTTRIADLQAIIDYPPVGTVPAGSALTTTQLTTVARALRDAAQENRVGIQRNAVAIRDLARLVRGDFGTLDP